jgi:type IX secretion system substrate protein
MKVKKMIFLSFLLFLPLSKDFGQWVHMSSGMENLTVWSFAVNGNTIFAGNNDYSGVYFSVNDGLNWSQTSLSSESVWSMEVSGNYIYAGTGNGVFVSTNNGLSWVQTALNNESIDALAVSGNNVFAGTFASGVFRSTNNGESWTQTALNSLIINSLAVIGNYVFAGTGGPVPHGLLVSADNGITWNKNAFMDKSVLSLTVNGNEIFAGLQYYGIYKSTDFGSSWVQTSLNSGSIRSIAISGNTIFAGASFVGVFVSTDYGLNWVQKNEGLGDITIFDLSILNNFIFAGTQSNSVYRRPVSDFIGIKQISQNIPDEFALLQNYPNPFNPNTLIDYSVAKAGNVTLEVYDISGKKIATLVNEDKAVGNYRVDFNASGFASGIYLYTLKADGVSLTKKMLLVK